MAFRHPSYTKRAGFPTRCTRYNAPMHLDPIALAIPFFFLLIGIEVRVMRAQGKRFYRFADAVTDLSCGIGSELMRIFLGLVALALYTWAYEKGAFVHPPVWAQWA